jgi:hypothetical protein
VVNTTTIDIMRATVTQTDAGCLLDHHAVPLRLSKFEVISFVPFGAISFHRPGRRLKKGLAACRKL